MESEEIVIIVCPLHVKVNLTSHSSVDCTGTLYTLPEESLLQTSILSASFHCLELRS